MGKIWELPPKYSSTWHHPSAASKEPSVAVRDQNNSQRSCWCPAPGRLQNFWPSHLPPSCCTRSVWGPWYWRCPLHSKTTPNHVNIRKMWRMSPWISWSDKPWRVEKICSRPRKFRSDVSEEFTCRLWHVRPMQFSPWSAFAISSWPQGSP